MTPGNRTTNWHRKFKVISLCAAILLGTYAAVSWFVGSSLVAPAHRTIGSPPGDLPAESITIQSASGSSLSGWFIEAEEAKATVILLHPIRGDRRAMLGRARRLHAAGFATLLIDLQAHGESTGETISAGFFERHDVKAAVDFARGRNPTHQIGIIGWSLGGAAALLASPLQIDAMVLESVYPSISEAVHNRVSRRLGPLHHLLAPTLLLQLKPRLGVSVEQLRPIDHIRVVECPVLVASGDLDTHTTLAETERLFDAAQEPKQLVIFKGAAHTDLMKSDPIQYERDVIGFLQEHLTTTDHSDAHNESLSVSQGNPRFTE